MSARKYRIEGLTAAQLREINGALAIAQAAAEYGDDNGLTSLRAINNARQRVHEAMEKQGVQP